MILKEKNYKIVDFIIIPFLGAPFLTVMKVLDSIINAFIPTITALATASFIDTGMEIFDGKKETKDILLSLFVLIMVISYKYLDVAWMSFVDSKITINLSESFRVEIIKKRAKLQYQHIENDTTWELVSRVCSDPVKRVFDGFDNIMRLIKMIIQIASLLALLFTHAWWASLIIIAFSIPLFYVSIKGGKTNYDALKDATRNERKAKYLSGILSSRENVEERSLFGYSNQINEKWYKEFEIARKIKLVVEAKNFVRMKGASLITVLISFLISLILLLPLGNGNITIGIYIGFITATLNMVQMVSFDLSYVTSEIANAREYFRDLSCFSKLSEEEGALDLPCSSSIQFESLEFKNVSFKYPNTEKLVLDNCSFVIRKNMNYAFVGTNGAGKTTITKLLTGLYREFDGEILLNGQNIRMYSQAELKAIFSVVFQDFAKYSISVKDNILLGNVNNRNCVSVEKAIDTLELNGKIEKLPNGIESYLGKIKEGGVDLSGGEWQKIAIARLLVSEALISILDEPTAALDPMAEANVYEMFRRVSQNKTVIFITHRLGAARLADRIFVLDCGKVSEQGTHDELMHKDGIYAEMFEVQKGWYVNE